MLGGGFLIKPPSNMANEHILGLGAMILWTSFAILFLKLFAIIKARQEQLKIFEKGNVPSLPVSNIFIGNMNDTIYHPNNIKILDEHHAKLGRTIGTFYGPHPWAFTCDPELIQRLFVREANRFVNLNDYHIPLDSELGQSLGQLRDDNWRILRKALNPAFSNKQMRSDNVDDDIVKLTDDLVRCIQNHPLERLNVDEPDRPEEVSGRIVDVLYNAKKFSLGAIAMVIFGSRESVVKMEAKAKDEFIDKLIAASKLLAVSPAIRASVMLGSGVQKLLDSLKRFSKLGACSIYFQRVICNSIAARQSMSLSDIKRDRKLIDTLLETVDRYKLGDNVLKANLFFFLVAGFETTANTIALLIWLLAKHPEKQKKLRAAILSGNSNDKYMEWCIMECLRLYPAVPTGIGRELSEDYHYEGMTFYKGTSIVANFYSMHRLEEYWGHSADQFRPERFAQPMKHSAQYMAFGAGSRHCIGYNLAMLEIRTLLTRLITKYRIHVCSSSPGEIDFTSPNMIHMIIDSSIDLAFVEIQAV